MYEQLSPTDDLATYQNKLVETLLREMAFAIQKTLNQPDEANIHDLRRVCLRLRHALRLFAKILPRQPTKRIQQRLRTLQRMLAAVRSYDVALQTLKLDAIASLGPANAWKALSSGMAVDRRRSLRPLRMRLRKMQRSDALQRWRTRLSATG